LNTKQLRRQTAVKPCAHFAARAVGLLEAKQLRDGRWHYVVRYQCECGHQFTESYTREY